MAKNIIIVVLVIIIVVLAYMLMVSFPEKAEAECTTKCTETVQAQVTSAVQECIVSAQECQQTLEQVIQIPDCASALAQ